MILDAFFKKKDTIKNLISLTLSSANVKPLTLNQ